MPNELTTKEYWKQFWNEVSLPVTAKPGADIKKILHKMLPKSDKISLVEIGCAPGGWMVYFNRQFDYVVSGIEYEEEAAVATKKNMELQGIQADVLNADFFNFDIVPNKYDIVYSGGFIEHFDDIHHTVERICSLAKKYVITMVPNCYSVNGFISKTIRPDVFAGHKQIDKQLLRRVHEECGLKTMFCDYVSGLQFIKVAAHNDFFDKHKLLATAINIPFGCFNLLSRIISNITHLHPRTKLLSKGVIYIGKKSSDITMAHNN